MLININTFTSMIFNGKKIKELAANRKILIKTLYTDLGISQTGLALIIRTSKIDLDLYIRMCQYFNVSFDYFINDSKEDKTSINMLNNSNYHFSKSTVKCEKCEEKERTIKVQTEMISTQKSMIVMLQEENKKLKKEYE